MANEIDKKLARDAGHLDEAIRSLEETLADDAAKPADKRRAYTSFVSELGMFLRRHPHVSVLKRASKNLQRLWFQLELGRESDIFPLKSAAGRPIDKIIEHQHAWGAAVMTALMHAGDGREQAARKVARALEKKCAPVRNQDPEYPHWKSVVNLRERLMKGSRDTEAKQGYDDTVDWLRVSPEMAREWLADPD